NEPIVFLYLLGISLNLFFHVIGQATNGVHAKEKEGSPQQVVESGPYQKSAIPMDQLRIYETSMRRMVADKRGYLDDRLSQTSLAHQLKISKHHLSQVFSLRIGKNFNTYINELRINHAIELMRAYPEWTITEIFLASGFTAKASFNRYFKQFQGCTPTEYRNGIK